VNLYKTVITFSARDDHEARIINTAVSQAAVRQIPETRSVRMERVTAGPPACVKWIGLVFLLWFVYACYCIATGFWR
jgi:hypothetical protein